LLLVGKGCYREEEAGSNGVSLAMLLTLTTAVALAQTEPGASDEFRCLLPEGCDMNGDGAPDLRAGQPVPGGEAGMVQYDNTT
jgi:hypothetical protein